MHSNKEEIEGIRMGMAYEKAVELYLEKLVERGTNPSNHGTLDDPDGYGKITGICGDTVEMFLKIRDKKVEKVKFVTDGCMFAVASCSVAAEMAEGKTVEECIESITQSAILATLKRMPKDHEHCALLASLAIQKALRKYVKELRYESIIRKKTA